MTTGRLPSVEGGIQPTIVDAKGDIIAATAADTVSRLAVGANDTVLTADSSTATGLKWATPSSGGLTLLSTTTLSGSSVTVSSISQDYKHLQIFANGIINGGSVYYLRINGDTGSNYVNIGIFANNSSTYIANSTATYAAELNSITSGSNIAQLEWNIFRYTNSSEYKFMRIHNYGGTSSAVKGTHYPRWDSTNAINSITLYPASGTLDGGTLYIYGVS